MEINERINDCMYAGLAVVESFIALVRSGLQYGSSLAY